MNEHYAKTDAGREEIRYKAQRLSRVARNLLLILDESHSGLAWVDLVHGANAADLSQLLRLGFIERLPERPAQVAPLRLQHAAGFDHVLARLSYDQLYNLMTSQARDRLGLLYGYVFILKVERCANVDELRSLFAQFLQKVRQHQGDAAVRKMQLALGVAV